jgi:hypothetical protein
MNAFPASLEFARISCGQVVDQHQINSIGRTMGASVTTFFTFNSAFALSILFDPTTFLS